MKISWILVTLFIYLFVQTVKTVENKKYTYDTKYIEVPVSMNKKFIYNNMNIKTSKIL